MAPETQSFRHIPGLLLLGIAFGGFSLYYGIYRFMIVGATYGWLFSPKGILLLGVVLVGNIFAWFAVAALWRTSWKFTFTATRFIAVHRLRRQRIDVPWPSIVRVSKQPRSWWNGRGGVAFSQIEMAEGHRIPFGTHMLRYRKFLEELKARAVHCRSFEAYRNEWDK